MRVEGRPFRSLHFAGDNTKIIYKYNREYAERIASQLPQIKIADLRIPTEHLMTKEHDKIVPKGFDLHGQTRH